MMRSAITDARTFVRVRVERPMQKCPQCGYRKIQVQIIRDPRTDKIVKTLTVCTNCQSVINPKKFRKWWRRR
jgi:DNA-directed RNA polymerase subunit M/transcription elongation factor TFIIS